MPREGAPAPSRGQTSDHGDRAGQRVRLRGAGGVRGGGAARARGRASARGGWRCGGSGATGPRWRSARCSSCWSRCASRRRCGPTTSPRRHRSRTTSPTRSSSTARRPTSSSLDGIPIGPTWQGEFFLGADTNGRDVAVRLLYGGRNSLLIGVGGGAHHDTARDRRRCARGLLPRLLGHRDLADPGRDLGVSGPAPGRGARHRADGGRRASPWARSRSTRSRS